MRKIVTASVREGLVKGVGLVGCGGLGWFVGFGFFFCGGCFFGRSLSSYRGFSFSNFLWTFLVIALFVCFKEFRFRRQSPRELVTIMSSAGPKSGLFLTWIVFVGFFC